MNKKIEYKRVWKHLKNNNKLKKQILEQGIILFLYKRLTNIETDNNLLVSKDITVKTV